MDMITDLDTVFIETEPYDAVSAVALRACLTLAPDFDTVETVVFVNDGAAWVEFDTIAGKLWCRLISNERKLVMSLTETSFNESLSHITIMEQILTKLEDSLNLQLVPATLISKLDSVTIVRLTDDDVIADIALTRSIVSQMSPSDINVQNINGFITVDISSPAPILTPEELSDLAVGDMILWPEGVKSISAKCQCDEWTWDMSIAMPRLFAKKYISYNSENEPEFELRWPKISISANVLSGDASDMLLPTDVPVYLIHNDVKIAEVAPMPLGAIYALFVMKRFETGDIL
jgi:hypothetical protein